MCYAISQLAAGFEQQRGTSAMSPYFKDVVQALLETVRWGAATRHCKSAVPPGRGQWGALVALHFTLERSACAGYPPPGFLTLTATAPVRLPPVAGLAASGRRRADAAADAGV